MIQILARFRAKLIILTTLVVLAGLPNQTISSAITIDGTIVIEGDQIVRPQHTARQSVRGLPPKAGAVWKIKPLEGQNPNDIEWISDRKGPAIRWIAPAGLYEVTCTYGLINTDGTLDLDTTDIVITIDKPAVKPDPKPPTPDNDPLFRDLRTFYRVSDKSYVDQLAEFYEKAASLTVKDRSLSTLYELQTVIHNAIETKIKTPLLKDMRDRIAVDHRAILGTDAKEALTQANRDKAEAQYIRVGKILRTLTGGG